MPTAIQCLIILISQIYGHGIQTMQFTYNKYKSFKVGLNYLMKKLFHFYLGSSKLKLNNINTCFVIGFIGL